MKRVKVLLVDDSAVFAQAAKEFLAGDARLDLLSAAASALEALGRIDKERPDIVLMDLNMPEMDGLEATRRIKAERFPPRVVVISLDDSPANRIAAHVAGADAFLGKRRFGTEMPGLIGRWTGPADRSNEKEASND